MICNVCREVNFDTAKKCRRCHSSLDKEPIPIEFAFICQKQFAELRGKSNDKRYCDTCNLDVINLDPLDDQARIELLSKATNSAQRLCVSVTQPIAHTKKCPANLTPQPTTDTAHFPTGQIMGKIKIDQQAVIEKWRRIAEEKKEKERLKNT